MRNHSFNYYLSGDRRKQKRAERKAGAYHPVYEAYLLGQCLAEYGPKALPPRLRQNPYPPGRRHDEWNRGRNTPPDSDPYEAKFGRNV
jgi:hypothetical protein